VNTLRKKEYWEYTKEERLKQENDELKEYIAHLEQQLKEK